MEPTRPTISVSKITTYLTCSLLYRFRYIEELEPEFTPDTLVFGNAIHDAVMLAIQNQRQGRSLSKAELKEAFEALWSARLAATPDIQFGEGQDAKSLLAKGIAMVACYAEEAPKDAVLAVEQRIATPLRHPDGLEIEPLLVGYLDLLIDVEGRPVVVDLKTAAARYSEEKLATDLQATAYTLAVSEHFGHVTVGFEFRVLLKTKEPKLLRYPVSRSNADFLRFAAITERVVAGVQAAVFVPNDGSWACSRCSYKTTCSRWGRHEGGIST